MTNTGKMTKRDYFNILLNIEEVRNNEAMVEFINHELELLARKNSSDKKPTAVQKMNVEIKEVIYNVLKNSVEKMTITQIQKSHEKLIDLSNQRISALIRQLRDENKVERIEEKRKAYFIAI